MSFALVIEVALASRNDARDEILVAQLIGLSLVDPVVEVAAGAGLEETEGDNVELYSTFQTPTGNPV